MKKNSKSRFKLYINNHSRRSENLPDIDQWLPRDASSKISDAFAKECGSSEERIVSALRRERAFSVDNYDAGLPFEAIVRSEIRRLLPKRYLVTEGLILDRYGKTAGNCDIIIFNETWFSPVKSPIVEDGGKPFLPIEGVYAVGEVKQSLSKATLHEAMKKLVTCHRLSRPTTYANRITENRDGDSCVHGLTNPLCTFIFSGEVAKGADFQGLIKEFFDINSKLSRLEMVRAICVPNHGMVAWGYHDPLQFGSIKPALFLREDLFYPIFPIFYPASDRSSLLCLMQMMQLSLYHVILGPEDIATAYGFYDQVKAPNDSKFSIQPDDDLIKRLKNSKEMRF